MGQSLPKKLEPNLQTNPHIPDNHLKAYNGSSYYYDSFSNLIHRKLANGEVQNYFYDLHNQLVKAEIFKMTARKRLGPTPTMPWAEG
ncbi:TPA: hypothetical protein ACFP3Z_001707 [Neisseria subflava]|uniref:hypothetical protein n=1 Tax=Neisseria sp. 27098_8_112 TaxID=3003682 RepID=UPI00352F17BC